MTVTSKGEPSALQGRQSQCDSSWLVFRRSETRFNPVACSTYAQHRRKRGRRPSRHGQWDAMNQRPEAASQAHGLRSVRRWRHWALWGRGRPFRGGSCPLCRVSTPVSNCSASISSSVHPRTQCATRPSMKTLGVMRTPPQTTAGIVVQAGKAQRSRMRLQEHDFQGE